MEQMAFRTQFTWLAVIMLCLWHFIEEFQVEMRGDVEATGSCVKLSIILT